MRPGSYYLEIQLTEYLLIALEFVTYQKIGTCHLEVKFIDYLPTSLEFITHHTLRSLWRLSDGYWTTREEPLSLLRLQVKNFWCRRFVKNFQKVVIWRTPSERSVVFTAPKKERHLLYWIQSS